MKKCEKCGAENTDTLAFCTNCGAPLISSPAPAPAPTPEPVAPTAPIPETPTQEATAEAPKPTETPTVPAPEPMPAPTAETTTPVNPAPSTIPTPTPVSPTKNVPLKKDNKLLMIILIVAVAVIGIIVAVIMIMSSGGSSNPTPTVTETNNSTETEVAASVVTSSTADGTNITLGDYQLIIPKAYDYKIAADGIYLGDASQAWIVGISYSADTQYTKVTENLEKLVEQMNDTEGITVLASSMETIGDTDYSYIDYNSSEIAMTMGFFKAPNDAVFVVEATNGTATIDHGLLGAVAPILATATETKEDDTVKIGNGLITEIDKSILDLLVSEEE